MFPYMQSRTISQNASNACVHRFTRASTYHEWRESPALPCSAPVRLATIPRPALARLDQPLGRWGALTVALSQLRRAAQTGSKLSAPPSDLATRLSASAAAPRYPCTPLAPLHALPASPATCVHLWRRMNAATGAAAPRGCPMEGPSATRWRRVGGAHACGRDADRAGWAVSELE